MNNLPKELQLEIISYLGKDFMNLNLVSKYYRTIFDTCLIFFPLYGDGICVKESPTIYVLFSNLDMNFIIKNSINRTNKYSVVSINDYYKFLFNEQVNVNQLKYYKGRNIFFNTLNIKVLTGNQNKRIMDYNNPHYFPYKIRNKFMDKSYSDYIDFRNNQYGKGQGQTGPTLLDDFTLSSM